MIKDTSGSNRDEEIAQIRAKAQRQIAEARHIPLVMLREMVAYGEHAKGISDNVRDEHIRNLAAKYHFLV